MCFHAADVLTGRCPGPCRDDTAELAARMALIDEADFAAAQRHDDAVLAEHYGAPLDQIRARRRDLQRVERVDARDWRVRFGRRAPS